MSDSDSRGEERDGKVDDDDVGAEWVSSSVGG